MTNLQSTLKTRDITFPRKVHIVKAMVFPVVMYGYESWTIKKSEHQRIDAFELWCWRRVLRVPWTRRSNQSILKEINPEYSLEGLMLRLKLQYPGLLIRRADSLEKILMLRKTEAKGEESSRGWGGWMVYHWLGGHACEKTPGDSEGQRNLVCCNPWDAKESDTTEWLNTKIFPVTGRRCFAAGQDHRARAPVSRLLQDFRW